METESGLLTSAPFSSVYLPRHGKLSKRTLSLVIFIAISVFTLTFTWIFTHAYDIYTCVWSSCILHAFKSNLLPFGYLLCRNEYTVYLDLLLTALRSVPKNVHRLYLTAFILCHRYSFSFSAIQKSKNQQKLNEIFINQFINHAQCPCDLFYSKSIVNMLCQSVEDDWRIV